MLQTLEPFSLEEVRSYASAHILHVAGNAADVRMAPLCRMYRQMKVPPQYTIAGLIVLCSVIHYYTKYQMYESVRSCRTASPLTSHAGACHAYVLSRNLQADV